MNKKLRVLATAGALCLSVFFLGGCVNQSEETKTVSVTCAAEASDDGKTEKVETLLQIDDPEEKAAVEAARKRFFPWEVSRELSPHHRRRRISATS